MSGGPAASGQRALKPPAGRGDRVLLIDILGINETQRNSEARDI